MSENVRHSTAPGQAGSATFATGCYDTEADAALHIGDTIGVEAGIRKERLDFFDRYYAAQRGGND